jgi:hypothetical protein
VLVFGIGKNSRSLHYAAFHPVDEDQSPGTPVRRSGRDDEVWSEVT